MGQLSLSLVPHMIVLPLMLTLAVISAPYDSITADANTSGSSSAASNSSSNLNKCSSASSNSSRYGNKQKWSWAGCLSVCVFVLQMPSRCVQLISDWEHLIPVLYEQIPLFPKEVLKGLQ